MESIKNEEIARLEEIRRLKEEAERKIRERTTKLVNIFKGYIYKLILPGLFYKGVKEDMDKMRKAKRREYRDTFPPITDSMTTALKNAMLRAARELWEQDECIHCITSGKQDFYQEQIPSSSEMDRRCNLILGYCTKILEELLSETFKDQLSGYILSFIGLYFNDGSYLQNEFHTDYEICRLEFNTFGGISKMKENPERKTMMITYFIIMHGLLARVLSKPWDIDIKYTLTPPRRLNVRVVCSILYYYFEENFREIPPIPANTNFLDGTRRTELRKDLYMFGRFPN